MSEQNYLNTMRDVLDNGTWQKNERTGEMCCTLDGAMTRFDISEAFTCATTTKKLAWKSITGEFCGFLRGVTNAADFRALGSKVWDQNANENQAWLANAFRQGPDHLGDVYGAMWRRWPAYKVLKPADFGGTMDDESQWREVSRKLHADGWKTIHSNGDTITDMKDLEFVFFKEIDQLGDCIRKLILTPSDRRILFHGWNPAKLDEIALPACHLLYQFLPNLTRGELNLAMYQRSNDAFLGLPFNFAECGLLLELVARLTGFKPNRITHFAGDVHIYKNHVSQVEEQLSRTPLGAPQLNIDDRVPTFDQLFYNQSGINVNDTSEHYEEIKRAVVGDAIEWLSKVEPSDFTLDGYIHHSELKAPMAV
jgi:thymidylate synthase